MIWECAITFGYFLRVFPDFRVSFLAYSRIFGYHFSVRFVFLFGMIQILSANFNICLMTLWNAAFRALVSYFLQSDLTYSRKKYWQ